MILHSTIISSLNRCFPDVDISNETIDNVCLSINTTLNSIMEVNRMYYGKNMDYFDFMRASDKSVHRFVEHVFKILNNYNEFERMLFCCELEQIMILEIATILSNEDFTKEIPIFRGKTKEMI